MANILTGMRIICSLLILVFPTFSKWYYLLYILGGITDAIDGTVARKLGQDSEFGSKFDTIADFIFAISVTAKIISSIHVPIWLIVCITIIALLKIFNVIIGYLKYKKIITVHSILNKSCGVVVYLVPLFIGTSCAWQIKFIGIVLVCAFTFVVAIVESVTIFRCGKNEKIIW